MAYRAQPVNPAYPAPKDMQATVLGTWTVPVAGAPGSSPVEIAMATYVPCRVEVTNLSVGDDVFLGFSAGGLTVLPLPNGQCYTLPGGASRVFLLARGQHMFASTMDAGVKVTTQVSEISEGGFPFEG